VSVPILKQGRVLIASIQSELTDGDWNEFRDELLGRAGDVRARGAVIDVSKMEIMDSFAGRILGGLAQMLRLRGVKTVVVGIQASVAFAMVQLGLHLEGVQTALDLEEGLARLDAGIVEAPRRER